jgi:DNA mismatch repair ATPase MutS
MKALLMHPDRDFDLQQALPAHAPALTQDLEVNVLLRAMAGDDEFLLNVARRALFAGLHTDIETILHRQGVLQDCLHNPAAVRELYALTVTACERKSTHWLGIFSRYPGGILYEAVELLLWYGPFLHKLKQAADTLPGHFHSRGFTAFFAMLRQELDDAYFATIKAHLRALKFASGVLESAQLGLGMEGAGYVLRQPQGKAPNWFQRLIGRGPKGFTIRLAERDEAGARILGEMRDRGVNLAANALAQSTDHILSFFALLRVELGFYVGCLNLHNQLAARGVPICFPKPETEGSRALKFRSLHDASLALTLNQKVVSNDLDADGKNVLIVTGANQGGKSSFLRAAGLAQLMMQCGLFVAAESLTAEICAGLFTHYKREEDATLKSGKLDEELARMSGIVDAIAPHALVLFNESFASTNEREGSEIARQIVNALIDRGIKVFSVTHLYDFAHLIFQQRRTSTLFLRAQRRDDGTRTFKILPGEPLETSYGQDVYEAVFAKK